MHTGPGDRVCPASSVRSEAVGTFFIHPRTTAMWNPCFVPGPKLALEGCTAKEPWTVLSLDCHKGQGEFLMPAWPAWLSPNSLNFLFFLRASEMAQQSMQMAVQGWQAEINL